MNVSAGKIKSMSVPKWLQDTPFSDKPDYPVVLISLTASVLSLWFAWNIVYATPVLVFLIFLLNDIVEKQISEGLGVWGGSRLVSLSNFFGWTALTMWIIFTSINLIEAHSRDLPFMILS